MTAGDLPPLEEHDEPRGGPLITIRPRYSWLTAELATYALALMTLALLLFGYALVDEWLRGRGVLLGARIVLGASLFAWVVLLCVVVHLNRRIWYIELHEHGVVLRRRAQGATKLGARWTYMEWFDDSHRHLVRLQVRDDRQILMATRDEDQRTRVLGLLVKKGVRRREE